MKINDKWVAISGVVILLIASIGVYLWNPHEETKTKITIEDFYDVSSSFSVLPSAISVPDSNPFYALILTPLAIHYDVNVEQSVVPLYVKNYTNPSRAIKRTEEQVGLFADLFIADSSSAKDISLSIVEEFWESSDAVLIIKNNQSGYNLGVIATPLASYLSIPIVVVDKLDNRVNQTLDELGVKKSIVCGDVKGFGKVLRFNNVDEIVNASINLVREKFGEINYITLTNPIDARTPEVLDSASYSFGPVKLPTISTMQIGTTLKTVSKSKGDIEFEIGSFTIPEGYKYALVKFEGVNLNHEDVDLFGDQISFKIKGILGGDTSQSPSVYDTNGNMIIDRFYAENVLYNMGGTEHTIKVIPSWVVRKEGEVKATVTIEKLSDPLYPMMNGLSSVAPYLTAYRKGVIFGKQEFAFVADDDVFTEKAETCAGPYTGREHYGGGNKKLQASSNEHIINNIHLPLNRLLAKLADLPVKNPKELGHLREYYRNNPVYITLVGGATVIPQYIYDNDIAKAGTATDVVYGDIDPIRGWGIRQDDVFTSYPSQENVVGRITGWDAQDASALITRTIFYDGIIDGLGNWKNRATVQTGCGVDFAKPRFPMRLAELLGSTEHDTEGYDEPVKWLTGFSKITYDGIQKEVLEPMGFETTRSTYFEAMRKGLSNVAINKLKKANLLNLLLLSRFQLKYFIGEKHVTGGEEQENSNFVIINGHGAPYGYTVGNVALAGLGLGYGPILPSILQLAVRVFSPLIGPGASITIGEFDTRGVENMNFGPSFMWFESCLVGAIDGRYPQTCISQAYLHAGMNAVVASPTPTSVPGGYLEPYRPYSTFLGTIPGYIKATLDARRGIYPERHFGEKMYEDMLKELKENDATVGLALRNARNKYLPEDADWPMYWSPPLSLKSLVGRKAVKSPYLDSKYICYQEYCLYGDPAFNPYEPCNLG